MSAELEHIVASFSASRQPDAAFEAFDHAVERSVGRLFLTMFRLLPEQVSERIFSTVRDAYPVGALKPLPQGGRAANLYRLKTPFIALGLSQIRAEYEGHEKVIALGADGMANFPIVYRDVMIGAVNIGGKGWTDPAHLTAVVQPLVQVLGPVVRLIPPRE